MGNDRILGYVHLSMKLKKILDAHQKFSDQSSLADNLGDGYLLAHNLIYLRVRHAALRSGLRFSSKRFYDYEVLPLTQLPKILAKKTIPYVPNVRALQEIEEAMPGVFLLMEIPPLRANYVLHETAHGLARLVRMKYLSQVAGQKELALVILLEEAFANAAESLMSVYVHSQLHEEFLLKNAYIVESLPVRNQIKKTLKLIGLEATFRLMLISFLHANLLKTKISASEFNRILTVALMNDPKKRLALDQKTMGLLREVFLGGFDLDPLFTIRTNRFCLRLMGINSKLDQLFNFDFLEFFENDVRYQHCLNEMGAVIACKEI